MKQATVAYCPCCNARLVITATASTANRGAGGQLSAAARVLKDADWLRNAYASKSIDVIADELSTNNKTVRRWMRVHGILTRTAGEATAGAVAERRVERRAAIIKSLQDWAAAHDGDSPTQSEWDAVGSPTSKTVSRHFASWNAALREAGLAVREPGQNKNSGQATAGEVLDGSRQMVTGGDMGAKRYGPGGGYA